MEDAEQDDLTVGSRKLIKVSCMCEVEIMQPAYVPVYDNDKNGTMEKE